MQIHISNKIYDKIEPSQKERVINKLYRFAEELSQNHSNITAVSKGFWSRSINCCPGRYKFRVNNKDRIIFEYGKNKEDIYFLDYCNHDDQIRSALNIQKINPDDLDINHTTYEEEKIDTYIDESLRTEAFTFVDNKNWEEAEKLFKAAGDKKNAKKVNFLKEGYEEELVNFNKYGLRKNTVRLIPNQKFKKGDILYLLNRLNSEYHYVVGRYYTVLFHAINNHGYLSGNYKKITDYNLALANQIEKIIVNGTEELSIYFCFYHHNEPVEEHSVFILDYYDKTFKREEANYLQEQMNEFVGDMANDQGNKELMFDAKISKSKNLAQNNLDFIFGK